MEIKMLNENLQDYYEDEILGKKFILRELLNIEFPLNALTNNLGEYLGYDEEDFTEEDLDKLVKVTDIYTDADGYVGAEIKFENKEENNTKVNVGTVVKILQKDVPYNAYGKTGTVVDVDYEATETWYQVRFDEPNPETPYETWVRERDLQVLNENTLNENVEETTDKLDLIDKINRIGMNYLEDNFETKVDVIWQYFVDTAMFTEDEITLVTNLNGYNEETMNDILYARFGYRDLPQYLESEVLNENENILNEGAINFTYSDYDLATYVFDFYNTDVDVGDYPEEYFDETGMYFREVEKTIKRANLKLREQQKLLVAGLNDEEVAHITEEIGHEVKSADFNRDRLEYEELLELGVWPGYYDGFSIGFDYVDSDIIRMRTETNHITKNFANALINAAEVLLAEIAEENFMVKARNGGYRGPILDESELNEEEV